MRSFAIALAFATPMAVAQSPLNTLAGGTNSGNVGGGIYFDLQVNTTIMISRIDFRCGANTVAGTGFIDMFMGPATYLNNVTNAGLWAIVASTTATTVAPSAVTSGVFPVPFALGPGNYGVALRSNGHSHGYTNGAGNTPLTCGAVPGSCLNTIFSTAEMTLRGGAAQNAFLTGGIFQPRMFNGAIHYIGGTPPGEPYGNGCYDFFHSFRELYPSTATSFDLGNAAGTNSIALSLNTNGGYDVTPLNTVGTFFPVSTGLPIPGAPLPTVSCILAENALASITLPFPIIYPTPAGPVSTTTIEISDNGYVSPAGTGTPAPVTPTVAGLLTGPPRWAPFYHDNNPVPGTVGAGVFVEQDPVLPQVYVTWNNLPDTAITGGATSTFQLMLNVAGNVEYRWRAVSNSGGGHWPSVVGWTPGGSLLDPGDTDISATGPFSTGPAPVGTPTFPNDNPGLALNLSAPPILGHTTNLLTTNIPSGTALGVNILSFVQIPAGLDLTGFGAPGCFLYANAPSTNAVFLVAPPGGTSTFPFAIPHNPAFIGFLVFGQSATFTPNYNALGILFSNGMRMQVRFE